MWSIAAWGYPSRAGFRRGGDWPRCCGLVTPMPPVASALSQKTTMAGSAILDPTVLVDDLVTDVIDGLRGELHPAFGVRAYQVFTVVRTWSGGDVGVGDAVDVEVELTPSPLVHPFASLSRDQEPCGYDVAGMVKLTEVSLTYTQAELLAVEAADGVEHLIKTTEAHGQLQQPRYWVHAKAPYPDRIKDMAWIVWLELVEDQA